ncbi:MAG: EAL domain-containing protein (putative c-di-GMP-specific phosphodiesterase class I) [Oleispira sp.]|jgi:EAL domain-containing protein (putative c-di-GMP-specific phosphodiesterase class I)
MSKFFPYFQPIVDIPSGKIVGYEALARTRDEKSGEVISCGPMFSDANVQKDFLLDIDRTVRQLAIEAIAAMPSDTFITLNISPEWIDLLDAQQDVPTIEMIKESGVDPRRIIIEITEKHGDVTQLQRLVSLYRAEGMRIAIDDFGAGFSEIGRLIALEPDIIKLDMRFFKSAIEGGIADDALRAVAFMAERIGCEILCEGVETEKEFNFAIDCGATLIQGFLFHPAVEHFVEPVETRNQVSVLRSHFLKGKILEEQLHCQRYAGTRGKAHLIKQAWGENNRFDLQLLPTIAENVVRFYVCGKNGEQLSPNYDYGNQNWHIDESYMGLNWSSRPHLYQMLAVANINPTREVTSRPYRDRTSRELLQSIGLKLNESSILIVDYIA